MYGLGPNSPKARGLLVMVVCPSRWVETCHKRWKKPSVSLLLPCHSWSHLNCSRPFICSSLISHTTFRNRRLKSVEPHPYLLEECIAFFLATATAVKSLAQKLAILLVNPLLTSCNPFAASWPRYMRSKLRADAWLLMFVATDDVLGLISFWAIWWVSGLIPLAEAWLYNGHFIEALFATYGTAGYSK